MATKPSSPGGNPPEDDLSTAELREVLVKKARTSRRVSWLLDECIRIPGTNLRFGIDPLLGLFPYGGETVATIIGTLILGEAGIDLAAPGVPQDDPRYRGKRRATGLRALARAG